MNINCYASYGRKNEGETMKTFKKTPCKRCSHFHNNYCVSHKQKVFEKGTGIDFAIECKEFKRRSSK